MMKQTIGLGCMNLSHAYGNPVDPRQAVQTLQQAFELGYRHFDTATLYGDGNNEHLVGKALGSVRDQIYLASKCGMYLNKSKTKVIDGKPDSIKRQCEASLKRLNTDVIDLYYLHRRDFITPIEESVGALAELVQEGKIKAIGLSEVSALTLQRAHQVHPITAVQSEYSLWTRNPEIAVLDFCKKKQIHFVAFSPLARGYLSGDIKPETTFTDKDIRNHMPRFTQEHRNNNQFWLYQFLTIANKLDITPAQLALAWLMNKADYITPIPGSRSIEHITENWQARNLKLKPETLTVLDELINNATVSGDRYNDAQQKEIDTEVFFQA
jgi:aryl-alcohol dehydrogenase-like predicted oxidoreductase